MYVLCDGGGEGVVICKLTVKASLYYTCILHTQTHTHTHTDKTVSIIHAYSHDYATVNPSVLPWHWADEKDKGERALQREREGGREKVWEKWTVFLNNILQCSEGWISSLLCLLRCHMNLRSTLTPPTPSVQVSYCAAVTEAIDDRAATFENEWYLHIFTSCFNFVRILMDWPV